MQRIERVIETVIFHSRWVLAPFYLGLIVSLVLMLIHFVRQLVEFILHIPTAKESDVILGVLGLVDITFTATGLDDEGGVRRAEAEADDVDRGDLGRSCEDPTTDLPWNVGSREELDPTYGFSYGITEADRPLPNPIAERNSCRVSGRSRKMPSMRLVTMVDPCCCTPRVLMQPCTASITTPTPCGCSTRSSPSAISTVMRSWICRRRA